MLLFFIYHFHLFWSKLDYNEICFYELIPNLNSVHDLEKFIITYVQLIKTKIFPDLFIDCFIFF
jgi:hypothetical protein